MKTKQKNCYGVNRIYTKGIVNATNKQFAELDIEGFDFERYILGTYAKKDEVWKRPLTAMKQDIWEQLVKVEQIIRAKK